ncbi:MAG: imidazolonepropionase [Firmicutes bacterium]|nr:imidazolonepropionase [Bacillota bacterium]
MLKPVDLIIKNIGMLATPQGTGPKGGKEQGEVTKIKGAFVAIRGDQIAAVGEEEDLPQLPTHEGTVFHDAGGCLVTPGLVDPHTHLIFGGWRQRELSLKLKGVSYLDILDKGGGILSTVKHTRAASLEELVQKGAKALNTMLLHGTTCCEAKSGYGLNVEDELKTLRAIAQLNDTHLVDLVPTFMGAHAVPEEYRDRPAAFINLIKEEMIPRVAEEKLAEFNDVFCEDGVFAVEESRDILEAGKRYGLAAKVHADEITPLGGASLAAEVGAISAEHLIHATDEGIADMAAAGVIAILLPGTSLYLDTSFARARTMIEKGIPVALATDYNPGSCPTNSLQLIINLACIKYKMIPEEVLTAVTLNAAASIKRSAILGSLEVGKLADLVIWDAPDLDFIAYHFGVNLVKTVVKGGKIAVAKGVLVD